MNLLGIFFRRGRIPLMQEEGMKISLGSDRKKWYFNRVM